MLQIHELPKSVVEYLRYLEVIKNMSPLTIQEYAFDLRTFFRFLKHLKGLVAPDKPLDEIDISDIDIAFIRDVTLMDAYEFVSYCRTQRDNDAASRARKIVAIKRFFHYLHVQTKQLEDNPLQELDSPKLKKTLPKYLSLEESQRLLNSIDGAHKERDYCILTLFLNCGLRLAELVSLNISDIKEEQMTVTGKGNKERIVYLNQACAAAIKAYLQVRPHDGVKDRDALFLSSRKQRISPKTVQYIVKQALENAGLADKGYSTHKLRHTAATMMYQYGDVDVLLIKEILGHANLSTTEIYTHVVDKQLQEAMQANPLAEMQMKPTKKQTVPESDETEETDVAEGT